MNASKDVRKLISGIEHIEGVEIKLTGTGHYVVALNGRRVTTFASTPSDPRWRENVTAALRRAGITPSVKPKKPSPDPEPLMPVDEIRTRVKALPNRAEFARFLVEDMPTLKPRLRTYKNAASATSSFSDLVQERAGLTEWAHELLNQALRIWDSMGQARQMKLEAEVAPDEPEFDETEFSVKIPDVDLIDLISAQQKRVMELEDRIVKDALRIDNLMNAIVEHEGSIMDLTRTVNALELPAPAEANGAGQREQYFEVLIEMARKGDVDEGVLQRLDKLAGITES